MTDDRQTNRQTDHVTEKCVAICRIAYYDWLNYRSYTDEQKQNSIDIAWLQFILSKRVMCCLLPSTQMEHARTRLIGRLYSSMSEFNSSQWLRRVTSTPNTRHTAACRSKLPTSVPNEAKSSVTVTDRLLLLLLLLLLSHFSAQEYFSSQINFSFSFFFTILSFYYYI